METNHAGTIWVVGPASGIIEEKRVERGLGSRLASSAVNAVSISVLKKNMECFFSQIREILETGTERIGGFQVSEIEVCAQITGEGQVTLVGSGVKLEAQGGITFTLCRAPSKPDS